MEAHSFDEAINVLLRSHVAGGSDLGRARRRILLETIIVVGGVR